VVVDGFSETVHRTGDGSNFGFMKSIDAQALWREEFVAEKSRLHELDAKRTAAAKEKDEDKRKQLEEELESVDNVAFLPAPVGWPCYDDDDDESSGLPKLSIMMQIDLPPVLAKCTDLIQFVSMLGDLPARVTAELTEMLYKTTEDSVKLPIGMLMPAPELLTEYDRVQKFMPGENSLDAFCSAGYLSKQHNRMKSVVGATHDPIEKISLYNEYLSCSGRQGMSIILNGNLHSSSTLFAAKYIELAKNTVCADLRTLVRDVLPELYAPDALHLPQDAVWGEDTSSYLYWKRRSPSGFMEKNFCVEALLQRHNLDFFLLTPQNLKITNEVPTPSTTFSSSHRRDTLTP
jgi:hypothetical protein